MNPQGRAKQIVTVALILTAASVWGFNGWQLFAAFWKAPSAQSSFANPETTHADSIVALPVPIIYEPQGRDPFTYPTRVQAQLAPTQPIVVQEPVRLPVFSVQGVIDGTLIVSDPQGGQHFVKIGDRFLGIELLSIQSGSLQLRYQDKDFTHLLH